MNEAKKHRELKLSQAAFSLLESHYHNKWQRFERIYDSRHEAEFIKLAKEQERSHLFVPTAKSTIDILEAIFSEAFFSQGNPVEITYNQNRESDIASCLNVLAKHYYKEAKPYTALNMAFSSMARLGVGAVLPYWCDIKKLPVTRFVNSRQVAWDPEAETLDELQFTTYKFKQTQQEIITKVKSGFYNKVTKKDLTDILGRDYGSSEKKYNRKEVTEIYSITPTGEYECKSFIKGKLVREWKRKTDPIKFGYLAYILPSVDSADQETRCAAVGESVLEVIEHLIEELNRKRNQINDIHECIIDPYTMVGDEADIDPEDAGRIKGVVNVGNPDKVKRFSPTSTFDIEKEVAMISQDIDDATAINGMQRGQTSASDRRAASAMAMINANSSSRLSRMVTTAKDTMFNEWAKAWVRDIYINTPDHVVMELFGSNPLGEQGMRQEINYVVNVNFGQSINRDAKISELTMVLQMLNGREDADIMPVLYEVLKLILGDEFDIKGIFARVLGTRGDEALASEDGGQEITTAQQGSGVVGGEAAASDHTLGASTGGTDGMDDTQQSAAADNAI